MRNSERLTLNQVTNGAPVVRWQMEQWQFVRSNGVPAVSYRTCPQKHPPLSMANLGSKVRAVRR
jgi:hypothetical protein